MGRGQATQHGGARGTRSKVKIGDRVAAYDGNGTWLGGGVYQGRHKCPYDEGALNPKIELDDGRIIWGIQCWWGPEQEMVEERKRREVLARAGALAPPPFTGPLLPPTTPKTHACQNCGEPMDPLDDVDWGCNNEVCLLQGQPQLPLDRDEVLAYHDSYMGLGAALGAALRHEAPPGGEGADFEALGRTMRVKAGKKLSDYTDASQFQQHPLSNP